VLQAALWEKALLARKSLELYWFIVSVFKTSWVSMQMPWYRGKKVGKT